MHWERILSPFTYIRAFGTRAKRPLESTEKFAGGSQERGLAFCSIKYWREIISIYSFPGAETRIVLEKFSDKSTEQLWATSISIPFDQFHHPLFMEQLLCTRYWSTLYASPHLVFLVNLNTSAHFILILQMRKLSPGEFIKLVSTEASFEPRDAISQITALCSLQHELHTISLNNSCSSAAFSPFSPPFPQHMAFASSHPLPSSFCPCPSSSSYTQSLKAYGTCAVCQATCWAILCLCVFISP